MGLRGRKAGVYDVYIGDDLIGTGTIQEVARDMGIKEMSLRSRISRGFKDIGPYETSIRAYRVDLKTNTKRLSKI